MYTLFEQYIRFSRILPLLYSIYIELLQTE